MATRSVRLKVGDKVRVKKGVSLKDTDIQGYMRRQVGKVTIIYGGKYSYNVVFKGGSLEFRRGELVKN